MYLLSLNNHFNNSYLVNLYFLCILMLRANSLILFGCLLCSHLLQSLIMIIHGETQLERNLFGTAKTRQENIHSIFKRLLLHSKKFLKSSKTFLNSLKRFLNSYKTLWNLSKTFLNSPKRFLNSSKTLWNLSKTLWNSPKRFLDSSKTWWSSSKTYIYFQHSLP